MMEQLQQLGPVGIGIVALVVVVIFLTVIRKVVTLLFVILAVGFGGTAIARQMGWDIPFVLPGAITESARSAMDAAASVVAANDGPATVQPQSLNERSTAPAAAATATPEAAQAAEDVRRSEIRYNAPATLQLNMPVDLRLVVDASGGANPESELEGLPGEVREGQADLTEQVTASLSGSGFEIRPLKPLRQVLGDDEATTWQWEVTPRRQGAQTLILEVFAHPGGGEAADEVASFRDEIDVRVTFVSQALSFVQTTQPIVGFVAGGLSLLLAGMSFVRRRRRAA